MKKIWPLVIFLGTLFALFLFFYLRPTSYEVTYKVDKLEVNEKYNKDEKKYLINIKYKDQNFSFVTYDKYSNKRKLITKIDTEKKEDALCLKPYSDKLSIYPLCYQNNELISMHMFNEDNNKNVIEEYESFNVHNFLDKTYLLWNYHNIVLLNNENTLKYQILDKDLYNLKLVYAYSNYLIIPNQENDYSFKDFNVIDVKRNKMKNYKLDRDIYFDSYYLGAVKDKVYLVDKKNKEEYEINIKNGKLVKIKNPKIYENGKWEKISIKKLISNEYSFDKEPIIKYEIENDTLYATVDNSQIKVSNRKVTSIVKNTDDGVFYLENSSLYYFDLINGESKLITYNEWQFNYNDMIYIFD